MLSKEDQDKDELLAYISNIYVKAYSPNWIGLSKREHCYNLWHIIHKCQPAVNYGNTTITASDIEKLKHYIKECDGWFYYNEFSDEYEFISLLGWLNAFQNWLDLLNKQVNFPGKNLNIKEPDNVKSPRHYTERVPGIECIEVTQHFNFNLGNAIKYIWRAGLKDETKTIEDLNKAITYINFEINRLKGKPHDESI